MCTYKYLEKLKRKMPRIVGEGTDEVLNGVERTDDGVM